MAATIRSKPENKRVSLVLYCLVRGRRSAVGPVEFLMIRKQGGPTFPPTKFRPGENLYDALARPMEEDLVCPPEATFPRKSWR